MAGRLVGPIARKQAPALAAGFVRQAFDRAVDGFGPLRGAAATAKRRLAMHDGNVEETVRDVIDSHVKMAGAQGFATNLGGLAAMTVMVPANVSGLALLQCHLVATIAHLRGYDLGDPKVRNAVLACMLGPKTIGSLVKQKRLPGSPMVLATAPAYDDSLDARIATEVAEELLSRVAGKRTISAVARRTPVLGGGVGMVTDGYTTYQVGEYAAGELRRREPPAREVSGQRSDHT